MDIYWLLNLHIFDTVLAFVQGSTFTRRKRIVETKRRNILEQKRQNPGSVGQKDSEQINVSTILIKISIQY